MITFHIREDIGDSLYRVQVNIVRVHPVLPQVLHLRLNIIYPSIPFQLVILFGWMTEWSECVLLEFGLERVGLDGMGAVPDGEI